MSSFETNKAYNHSCTNVILQIYLCRSSHQRRSIEKGVLRNSTKFTGKHPRQSLFFNKVAGLRLRLWHRPFPVYFVKFLECLFLHNTSGGCFCITLIRLLHRYFNQFFHYEKKTYFPNIYLLQAYTTCTSKS